MFKIYFDSIQEGNWFKSLDQRLSQAELLPFPRTPVGTLARALSFDRPDIVLVADANPIVVIERTVEVPSGHNVGQRFARLVAAAQMRVPVVYFGPYAAYKHGGATQGPRYMNLRLFQALEKMAKVENTAITTINWPVDERYEIIQRPEKDRKIQQYLSLFFNLYGEGDWDNLLSGLMNSEFEAEQKHERDEFVRREVRNPEQYDGPPESVKIVNSSTLEGSYGFGIDNLPNQEVVVYSVGMRYIRSDPYTGMSMLYSYLYCGGLNKRTRPLILHFPEITRELWKETSSNGNRKDIRLFRLAADAIIFSDGSLTRDRL